MEHYCLPTSHFFQPLNTFLHSHFLALSVTSMYTIMGLHPVYTHYYYSNSTPTWRLYLRDLTFQVHPNLSTSDQSYGKSFLTSLSVCQPAIICLPLNEAHHSEILLSIIL